MTRLAQRLSLLTLIALAALSFFFSRKTNDPEEFFFGRMPKEIRSLNVVSLGLAVAGLAACLYLGSGTQKADWLLFCYLVSLLFWFGARMLGTDASRGSVLISAALAIWWFDAFQGSRLARLGALFVTGNALYVDAMLWPLYI
jgi:hypothetical protein